MATLSIALMTSGSKILGETMTLSTNRASTSYTHTIVYSWYGRTGTVAENVGDSCTWTPSLVNLAPYIPNSTSGTCTLTCYTYENGKLLGSRDSSITLFVPDTVKPTISSVDVQDTEGYFDLYDGYVAGCSRLSVNINSSGSYGSTISKYTFKVGSGSTNVSTSSFFNFVLPVYNEFGTVMLTSSVVDSRGRGAYDYKAVNIFSYEQPSLEGTSIQRWNTATNQQDDESSTVRVSVVSKICDVGNKNLNRSTIKILYRLQSGGDVNNPWITYTTKTDQGISSTFNVDMTGFSENTRYQIEVVCTDSFGRSATYTWGVDSAKPVIDLKSDGTGIGLLSVSNHSGITLGGDLHLSNPSGVSTKIYGDTITGDHRQFLNLDPYNSQLGVTFLKTSVQELYVSSSSEFSMGTIVYGTSNLDVVSVNGSATFNRYTIIPGMTIYAGDAGLLTSSNKKIPLTYTISNRGRNCFSLSSNGIKCTYSGYVKVSYSVQIYGLTLDHNIQAGVDIYKNSVKQANGAFTSHSYGGVALINCAPMLLSVSAGDTIYLYARSSDGSGFLNRAILNVSY